MQGFVMLNSVNQARIPSETPFWKYKRKEHQTMSQERRLGLKSWGDASSARQILKFILLMEDNHILLVNASNWRQTTPSVNASNVNFILVWGVSDTRCKTVYFLHNVVHQLGSSIAMHGHGTIKDLRIFWRAFRICTSTSWSCQTEKKLTWSIAFQLFLFCAHRPM